MRLLLSLRSFKCNSCKAVLNASPYDGSFVFYDGKYWCVDCLVTKRTSPKTKKDKWLPEEVNAKIETLKKETEVHLHSIVSKDSFYEYLDQYYAPSFVPKRFYEKMASIFDGSYKGLKVPIPPEDLLDMLQQKQSYLEKQAIKKWGDNPPDPISRINYDIAVVISRYDRYLAWKQKNEIETIQAKQQAEEREQSVQYVYHAPQTAPQAVNNELDIGSILEDLFD